MNLVICMLSFKPSFSLSSLTFIKRLFSSSLLFAIRVVSSAYLKLFIFLPAILITVGCASSSLAFHTMNSAYILDILISQFGTSQLFYVPFLCCFLTFRQVSQEADQVVWYSHLLKNFPQFVVIHIVPLHLLKFFSRKFLNLF